MFFRLKWCQLIIMGDGTFLHAWLSTLQSGIDVPRLFIFSKNAYQDVPIATLPLLTFCAKRTLFRPDPENCPVKVIHCQTFCPLFFVFGKCLHD